MSVPDDILQVACRTDCTRGSMYRDIKLAISSFRRTLKVNHHLVLAVYLTANVIQSGSLQGAIICLL